MIRNLALVHIICFRHYADVYIMLKKVAQYFFTKGGSKKYRLVFFVLILFAGAAYLYA